MEGSQDASMGSRSVRMQVMVGLLGCFSSCLAQTGPSDVPRQLDLPDPAVYASFFRQVAQLAGVSESTPILLNGEPSTLTRHTPQERLGLTDQETQVLNELATDCDAESRLLDDAVKRLTFERRLRVIMSQEIPDRLTQSLRDLDESRARIVADHVQRLEAAFGAERFRTLNDYIRSRQKDASFFPALPDPSRPVPKKAAAAKK